MSVVEEIRKQFSYLFDIYNFNVVSEVHFQSFGNWVVVLASKEYHIRFFQDRGYLDIALGPNHPQLDWESGPWFNLDLILSIVSDGKDDLSKVKKVFNNLSQQLTELSNAYQPYSESINQLFSQNVYKENEQKLLVANKQWHEQIWNTLKTPKVNKL
jgi:hypothetical protein